MAKAYTGIEIGARHLKMAVCDQNGVQQIAVEELPDQLSKDGRLTSYEVLSDAIRQAAQDNHITEKNCALVLNSRDTFTRRITMPAMTVDELELNLPFEFRDYLSDDKAKYRFDYAVLDTKYSTDGTPTELNLLACAAPIEAIDSYAAALSRAGFKLKIAAPDIMSFANLIRYAEQNAPVAPFKEPAAVDAPAQAEALAPTAPDTPDEGAVSSAATTAPLAADLGGSFGMPPAADATHVMPAAEQLVSPPPSAHDYCFLDIGSANTKVYLFPQGNYEVTRSIDLGIDTVTNALADHFGVDVALARTYLSSNFEDAQNLEVSQNFYERLSVEVSRILSFFNFNYPESHLDVVHFCGSGSYLEPLISTIRSHMSIELHDIADIMPPAREHGEHLRICPAAVGITIQ